MFVSLGTIWYSLFFILTSPASPPVFMVHLSVSSPLTSFLFSWASSRYTASAMSLLRNLKLMVNYIRPATQHGWTRTRRVFFSLRHVPPRVRCATSEKGNEPTPCTGPWGLWLSGPMLSIARAHIKDTRFLRFSSFKKRFTIIYLKDLCRGTSHCKLLLTRPWFLGNFFKFQTLMQNFTVLLSLE